MSDTLENETLGPTLDVKTIGNSSNSPSQKDDYEPSLEFDDGRNSQFLHIIGI